MEIESTRVLKIQYQAPSYGFEGLTAAYPGPLQRHPCPRSIHSSSPQLPKCALVRLRPEFFVPHIAHRRVLDLQLHEKGNSLEESAESALLRLGAITLLRAWAMLSFA